MYPPTLLTPHSPPLTYGAGGGGPGCGSSRGCARALPRPRAPPAGRAPPPHAATSPAPWRAPAQPSAAFPPRLRVRKKKKLISAFVSRHLPAPAPPLPSVGIAPPFYLTIRNSLLFCLTRTLSNYNNNKRQILLLCVTKTPFFFFSMELYSWSWLSERSLCV